MLKCIILLFCINWIDTHWSDFQKGTYDSEIYISRRLQSEINPTDSGCIEYHTRFDVNNDGWYDLISADRGGPYLRIWLGSASGYSAGNSIIYPISWGGNCDISDLNLDGYPEVIHSGWRMANFCIYWGTPSGPSPTDTTKLPNDNAEAVYVADLDKDTYLDIITAGGYSGKIFIYWGTPGGPHGITYSIANRTIITTPTEHFAHNIEVSDLDKNGWLDIIVIMHDFPYDVNIYYQDSARHFHSFALDFAQGPDPHGLSIADLNKDSYIDIIATGQIINYSSIYWGSPSGYSNTNKLNLNTDESLGGSAIVDFNDDGWLDILYFRGSEYHGISMQPKIYYNLGNPPYFSESYTSTIGIPLIASGGMSADFNKDGYTDVFINNHELYSYSYVFYGPNFTNYDSLPINVDHHGNFREPRQSSYYSRICKPCSTGSDTLITGGVVSWIANEPGNSKVHIYVRTSLDKINWTDWYEVTNGDSLPSQVLYKKFIQYKATLSWKNPSELPNLERISFNFSCTSYKFLIEPDTFSYANPGEKIKYKLRVINNTDANDTINLSFHHNQNWNAKITDTLGNIIDKIIVSSKDTEFIFFEIQVPENVSGGVRDTAFIKGISKNTGSKDSARCITEVKMYAIIQIGPDQEKIGSPGEVIKYYLKVLNLGNAVDTINLFIIFSKWAQNIIYDSLTNSPLKDNNSDGYQDVILYPSSFQTIFLNINIPENATPEEKDSTVIRANSTNSPNIYDDAILLTKVQKIFTFFKIEPDTEIYIPYNSLILIPVYTFFKGNSKDYVEIEWSFYGKDLNIVLKDSAGVQELIDNNQNGDIDLGLCPPEKKNYLSIYAKAPDFNYSLKDTNFLCNIKLKGYLFSSSSLYDSAKIKIFLIPPLHIHNYESPFFAREGTNFFISVPENGKGTLEIYSRLGEKIITLFKNKPLSRGIHIIPWNGRNERGNYVAPGVYIYIFEFKGEKISKTIIKKTGVK